MFSGMILGARLKALGVDFVIVEKNAKAGDNWANRYDSMRFHVYKTACDPPYIRKSK
jgi:cation diffusion facilitator CzcD-associated flavoprotein CzcO